MGLARKTVARAAKRTEPPRYQQPSTRSSIVEPYVAEMVRILSEYPEMSAVVLAKRVGFTGGRTIFYERTAQIKDPLAILDPVDRLVFVSG